jgi:serine protease Do
METLFYCNPANGSLDCLEMYPDEDSDPCEVYFADYRDEQGRLVPHRIEARYGDQVFGVFTLAGFDLKQAAEKQPAEEKQSGEKQEPTDK